MPLEHVGRDLYLRHTTVDGKSHIVEHRVWDAELFLTNQQQAAEKVNADQVGDAPRLARVELSTRDDYIEERSK